jgi:spore coat protein JB
MLMGSTRAMRRRSEIMKATRKEKLIKLMAEEFTAIELNLYLDTHPQDKRALELYNETVERLYALLEDYERHYGPISNFGLSPSSYPWQWIEEPWPWEINFCDREDNEQCGYMKKS